MSVGIWGVSASSYDSSSRTEQSSSASEVQSQSEAQQSKKAEQPKETSATINENDRAELSATRKDESHAQTRAETSGLAGRMAWKWRNHEEADGLKGAKATDNINDSDTVRMLNRVQGYEDKLNDIYKNAVPEVKKMYEKYEGKIKLFTAVIMQSKELVKFNSSFAETVSKKINDKKAKQGNQANQYVMQGFVNLFVDQSKQDIPPELAGLFKDQDPSKAEKNEIEMLLFYAQMPVNAGDTYFQAMKAQAIYTLTSKLTEAYGNDIDGLKAAVMDSIASTGYNTDKIASAKSVEEIIDVLSSLSAEGAYYMPRNRSIYIDAPSDLKESIPPGRTYFHEVGHLMDDAAFTLDEANHYKKIYISDNPEFRDAIKDDFKKYVDKYKKEHKDEISRIIKCCEGNDATASEKMSKKEKDIVDYIEKHPEIREKYSTEDIVAYRLISGMMQENVPKEENGGMTNLQLYQAAGDIVGGLTDNICAGYWSHPNEYWKSSESAITSETFAHMFQTSMTNDEELQKLKEIFPTAYKKFLEMVKKAS